MTTPDHDIEILLLLEASGELSPEQASRLASLRANSPEVSGLEQEITLLQDAGRFASRHTVPATPELHLERLRNTRKPAQGIWQLPLAIAAALVIGLGIRFVLLTPADTSNHLVVDNPAPSPIENVLPLHNTPDTLSLVESDPMLTSLDSLDEELNELASTPLDSDFLFRDSDAWASEWLALEESI